MPAYRIVRPDTALTWRPVAGFPGYEISHDGKLRRSVAAGARSAGFIFKPGRTANGYLKYALTNANGQRLTIAAHRLVATAFLPNPDDLPYVLHRNDVKDDNRVENLRWGTGSENRRDAESNGRIKVGENHPSHTRPWTRPRGEKYSRSKLKEADVLAILGSAEGDAALGRRFGVNPAMIWRIRTGKAWRHLSDPSYAEMLRKGEAGQ